MLRPGLVIVLLWLAFWVSASCAIYTGLLPAVYATAAAKGTIVGLIGALLVTQGLWMKARLEERWLREALDPGAYEDDRRKVPMLVPFGPR